MTEQKEALTLLHIEDFDYWTAVFKIVLLSNPLYASMVSGTEIFLPHNFGGLPARYHFKTTDTNPTMCEFTATFREFKVTLKLQALPSTGFTRSDQKEKLRMFNIDGRPYGTVGKELIIHKADDVSMDTVEGDLAILKLTVDTSIFHL